MKKRLNNSGFTLVELLIAMAFFSFILLFIITGFMIVTRSYTKGMTIKLVQDEGRLFVEQLTREIRTASTIDTSANCIQLDNNIYQWLIKNTPSKPNSSRILVQESNKTCGDMATDIASVNGEVVLNDRVGVQYMEVSQLTGGFYKIHIRLSTVDMDLIDSGGTATAECSVTTGDQYCDVVDFTTMVSTRQ